MLRGNGLKGLLVLFCCLLPAAAGAQYPEHFEGSFPPSGWTLYQMGDASSGWFQTTPGYESDHSAAHLWEDADCENWLVTSPQDLPSGKMGPIIHFRQACFSCSTYQYHGLWISTGSGDPNDGQFVELDSLPPGPEGQWGEYWTDLSAYGGQTVYLAFVYAGRQASAWLVDEVFIGVPPNIYLSDENVDPLLGEMDQDFTYSVTYRHNDDQAPVSANICIDGVPYAMTDPTGGAGPYNGGVIFTCDHRFAVGGVHNYYFEFSDGSETCRQPTQGEYYDPRVGDYCWDFEDGPEFTTVGPADDWQWGTPINGPGGAYSGSKAWGTVLDGEYSNNSQSRLMTPPLDLTFGGSRLELRIMSWLVTDTASVCDGGNVKMITATDTTLLVPDTTQGWPYNAGSFCPGNAWIPGQDGLCGSRPGEDLVFDLTSWTGQTGARICFDFGSDGSVTADGWYIDGIVIWGDPSLPVELAAFSAVPGDGLVTLSWETASEKENAGFDLYRRTAGGEFQRINPDRIPGAGSSPVCHTYAYVDRDVDNGIRYDYQLADVDWSGRIHLHDRIVSATPRARPAERLPQTFTLDQNYPNPFNPCTEIHYRIPDDGPVELRVFNVRGQQVACLVDGLQEGGEYSVVWLDREAAAGVYFCRLRWGQYQRMMKMVLVR